MSSELLQYYNDQFHNQSVKEAKSALKVQKRTEISAENHSLLRSNLQVAK